MKSTPCLDPTRTNLRENFSKDQSNGGHIILFAQVVSHTKTMCFLINACNGKILYPGR